MRRKKILVVLGTRPEAIKMAPLIQLLRSEDCLETIVCLTAQHRHMLDQVLNIFGIKADIDLNLMRQGQHLAELSASVLREMDGVIGAHKPDYVHGIWGYPDGHGFGDGCVLQACADRTC